MRRISLLFLAFVCAMSFFGADEVFNSQRMSSLPMIGCDYDWNAVMEPIEDGQCFVGMLNGDSGICFRILVKDRGLQSRFLREGLTVYLDANGKKKKKYSVVFPTAKPPKRGMRPENRKIPGDIEQRADEGDTLTNDLRQRRPGERPHMAGKRRSQQLKAMVSSIADSPVSFYTNKDEALLTQGSAGVIADGNNVVYYAYVPYEKIGRPGKQGRISLGIFQNEIKTGSDGKQDDFPDGMMPPPPGMMGGGPGAMPPPGMGGPGGLIYTKSEKMQKNKEKIEIWLFYSIKTY